jgi:fibronectin type 3 domain-containing protein
LFCLHQLIMIRIFILFILLRSSSFSQNVFESHFVKKDKILFRLVPKDRSFYDEMQGGPLKIFRIEYVNGTPQEKVLIKEFRNYYQGDTTNWMPLIRKNKNKASFIYQTLYTSGQTPQKDPKKKQAEEKMLFDLLLLNCDHDAEVAKACGLFFADSTINNSDKYEYIVSVYTSSIATKEMLRIKVDASVLSENKKITDLKGVKKKQLVTLQWKAKEYSSSYSGYIVERSSDGEKFSLLNKTPVIFLRTPSEKNKEYIFFKDTLPGGEKNFSYRVRGVNFFGEVSDPSNSYTVKNFIEPTSHPTIDSLNPKSGKGIYISWTMKKKNENERIRKFLLLRSDKDNGIYSFLHSAERAGSYLDTTSKTSTFFKVQAITLGGDTLESFSRLAILNDIIAPNPPSGVKATVDKNGKVTVSWNKNQEKDVQGYKIMRSNALNDEMTQLNSKFITDTFYMDILNLNTLSKKVFYSLVATDQNYNASKLSKPIEVRRPDTIKPIAPNLRSLYPAPNGVKIRFVQSSSDDVKQHIVLREEKNKTAFEVKKIGAGDTTSWLIDTLAEPETVYGYKILAADESGNIAKSDPLFIKYETGLRKKLKEFTAVADRKLKLVTLNWKYSAKGVEKFVIYRKSEKIPLSALKIVEANETMFIDNTVQMGNIYEYRIKAIFENGAESLISEPVKVEY